MRALILSAGEGTRLRPLTLDRPKPMLPVGGKPILEHLVTLLRNHGVTEIAMNLHYKPDVITDYFGDGGQFGVRITYSRERRLLGSAGAAKQLEAFLGEGGAPFFVLYGDVLANIDLTALLDAHRSNEATATLALYEVEDPSRCGIVDIAPDGRITRFTEKPAPGTATSNLANAGIYVLDPTVLRDIPGHVPYDFGMDVFPNLLADGRALFGIRTNGYLLDIGAPDRYWQAEADFAAGRISAAATRRVLAAGARA
jgi:mannose-1-phosphate guanylyltransferase